MTRLVALALLFLPGVALANPLAGVRIGMPVDDAVARLGGGATWAATEPQALAEGLVRTRLLEAINRAGVTPRGSSGGLDPAAFARLGRSRDGAKRPFVAAGGPNGLRFALIRWPTPVDARLDAEIGSSPGRLVRLRSALDGLKGYRLRPVEKDRYGNVFAWRGKGAGGRVWVRYWPADDELWVLLSP